MDMMYYGAVKAIKYYHITDTCRWLQREMHGNQDSPHRFIEGAGTISDIMALGHVVPCPYCVTGRAYNFYNVKVNDEHRQFCLSDRDKKFMLLNGGYLLRQEIPDYNVIAKEIGVTRQKVWQIVFSLYKRGILTKAAFKWKKTPGAYRGVTRNKYRPFTLIGAALYQMIVYCDKQKIPVTLKENKKIV